MTPFSGHNLDTKRKACLKKLARLLVFAFFAKGSVDRLGINFVSFIWFFQHSGCRMRKKGNSDSKKKSNNRHFKVLTPFFWFHGISSKHKTKCDLQWSSHLSSFSTYELGRGDRTTTKIGHTAELLEGIIDNTGRTGVRVLVKSLASLSIPFFPLIFSGFGRCEVHSKFSVFPIHPLPDRVK